MDLIDIAKCWYSFLTRLKELVDKSEGRIQICDTCPNKIKVSLKGQIILVIVNSESSIFRGTLCDSPMTRKGIFKDFKGYPDIVIFGNPVSITNSIRNIGADNAGATVGTSIKDF